MFTNIIIVGKFIEMLTMKHPSVCISSNLIIFFVASHDLLYILNDTSLTLVQQHVVESDVPEVEH